MADEAFSRLQEAMLFNLNLSNIPEYSARPSEDVEDFLKEFGRATATLTAEQKCKAMKRALTRDAGIYAKKYLKQQMDAGNWKTVKEGLRERFAQVDMAINNRAELGKMRFDSTQATLLGYIDRYENLYRKVYPKNSEADLISDVSLNLGAEMTRKLTQISGSWRKITQFEDFRTLIDQLEKSTVPGNRPRIYSRQ